MGHEDHQRGGIAGGFTRVQQLSSRVLLGGVFLLVVTPIGLLMRALGKDFLRLKLDPRATTYWIERDPPGPTPDSLKHIF